MSLLLPMAPLPLLMGFTACRLPEYSNADLQLDITAALPVQATQVRICVRESGTRTLGAGGDRYAMPGLPPATAATVTVDLLYSTSTTADSSTQDYSGAIVLARAGPATLDSANSYLVVALEYFSADTGLQLATDYECPQCPATCTAESTTQTTEEDSWLLAVRFLD